LKLSLILIQLGRLHELLTPLLQVLLDLLLLLLELLLLLHKLQSLRQSPKVVFLPLSLPLLLFIHFSYCSLCLGFHLLICATGCGQRGCVSIGTFAPAAASVCVLLH
jgi:hypothetical protein